MREEKCRETQTTFFTTRGHVAKSKKSGGADEEEFYDFLSTLLPNPVY